MDYKTRDVQNDNKYVLVVNRSINKYVNKRVHIHST